MAYPVREGSRVLKGSRGYVIYDGKIDPISAQRNFSGVGQPIEIDNKLAYWAREGKQWYMVYDGRIDPISAQYNFSKIEKPIKINNKLAHRAEKGKRKYVIYDGKIDPLSEQYNFSEIKGPFQINNKLAYAGKVGGRWYVVHDGEIDPVSAQRNFSRVENPIEVNNKLAYPAREGNRWYMIYDGKIDPVSEQQHNFLNIARYFGMNNKVGYVGRSGRKFYLIYDRKKISDFDSSSGMVVFGKDNLCAFGYRNNGFEIDLYNEDGSIKQTFDVDLDFLIKTNLLENSLYIFGEKNGRSIQYTFHFADSEFKLSTKEKGYLSALNDTSRTLQELRDEVQSRALADIREVVLGQQNRNPALLFHLNQMITENPRRALGWISAEEGPVFELVVDITDRVFPEIEVNRQKEIDDLNGEQGSDSTADAPSVEEYFNPDTPFSLEGADPKARKPKKVLRVLTKDFRGMLETSLGSYKDGRWQKLSLEVPPEPVRPSKVTAELSFRPSGEVVYPAPNQTTRIEVEARGVISRLFGKKLT